MLNPLVSCSVYAFEMLIIYVFFSRISERKATSMKTFLIGILLFAEARHLGREEDQTHRRVPTQRLVQFPCRLDAALDHSGYLPHDDLQEFRYQLLDHARPL